MKRNPWTAVKANVVVVALLGLSGCSAVSSLRPQPFFDLATQSSSSIGIRGEITSAEYEKQDMIQESYVVRNAKVRTTTGVEIDADQLALNTQTGIFMTSQMFGRITPDQVVIVIKRGSLLNIECKEHAKGDRNGYLMEGGASITMGQATVRAERIVLRYL